MATGSQHVYKLLLLLKSSHQRRPPLAYALSPRSTSQSTACYSLLILQSDIDACYTYSQKEVLDLEVQAEPSTLPSERAQFSSREEDNHRGAWYEGDHPMVSL
jgi:hypothetical protein